MTDWSEFLNRKRSTKPPARPTGLTLTPRQETRTRAAEDMYRIARREGWTRRRFYVEIHDLRGVNPAIRDNLIDHYKDWSPLPRERKYPPEKWTPRAYQESAIEMAHYAMEFEDEAPDVDYVIVQVEGGYRAYVTPRSPEPPKRRK